MAWADRPLVSETADVIERGACQVEAAAATSRASGSPNVRELGAVVTCGMAFDTQPALAYGRSRTGDGKEEALLLGAKTTLRAPDGARPGFGLAYSVGAVKAPALSWRREELSVVGLVTMEVSRGLLGHANLGWSRSRSARQNTTTWSLGVETVGEFTLAADAFGDDRGRPSVSAGVGYAFGKGLSANAALATLFEPTRVHQFSVGAKLVF
ncbi:MAG: hypothetical protein JNN03_04415 [Rubrivivax sp.]|nr:hypothetical protein [Rubrivivax sp.]